MSKGITNNNLISCRSSSVEKLRIVHILDESWFLRNFHMSSADDLNDISCIFLHTAHILNCYRLSIRRGLLMPATDFKHTDILTGYNCSWLPPNC